MFGFRVFDRLRKPQAEASRPAPPMVPAMVLVSREDIYRVAVSGEEPVLLLRKGSAIPAEELPRFIRNGAHPSQFQLQYSEADGKVQDAVPAFIRSRGVSNPIEDAGSLALRRRRQRRVLILEPEQKSLKRLIDCLFVCGFNLNHIHPVRLPEHLEWAVGKHCPQIVVADYALPGGRNGLSFLLSLAGKPGLECLVLMLPANPDLTEAQLRLLHKLCAEKSIKIITKPVSRFALSSILDETGRNFRESTKE